MNSIRSYNGSEPPPNDACSEDAAKYFANIAQFANEIHSAIKEMVGCVTDGNQDFERAGELRDEINPAVEQLLQEVRWCYEMNCFSRFLAFIDRQREIEKIITHLEVITEKKMTKPTQVDSCFTIAHWQIDESLAHFLRYLGCDVEIRRREQEE